MDNYLKIKNDIDLYKLLELGFEKKDYSKGEIGLQYLGVQYEAIDYYPVEEDGTRYEDDFGNNWRSKISVSLEDRLVYIEILNNDCTYHNEGSEVNFIANIIFQLTNAGMLEVEKK